MKWVAEHLGHNLEVHAKYYRQPIESVEVAKVAKLMYLVDTKKMRHLKGKDLDTIDEFYYQDSVDGTKNEDAKDDTDSSDEDTQDTQSDLEDAVKVSVAADTSHIDVAKASVEAVTSKDSPCIPLPLLPRNM